MPQLNAILLGLPVTANAQEMVDRAHQLGERLKTKESECEEWKKRAHEFQARCIENDALVARLKKEEGAALVDRAIADQKVHEHEREDLIALYNMSAEGAERVRSIVAKREFSNFDARTRAIRDVDPVNLEAEVGAKAAELMASEEKFRGKPSAAKLEVLKRNPALSKRYREQNVAGLPKGGDR